MRIKVGNQWFECGPGQPIMVELKPQDRLNIQNMAPDATKYAIFDEDTWTTDEEINAMFSLAEKAGGLQIKKVEITAVGD